LLSADSYRHPCTFAANLISAAITVYNDTDPRPAAIPVYRIIFVSDLSEIVYREILLEIPQKKVFFPEIISKTRGNI
jgi:hypothetical protein